MGKTWPAPLLRNRRTGEADSIGQRPLIGIASGNKNLKVMGGMLRLHDGLKKVPIWDSFVDDARIECFLDVMKSISVRDLKANWPDVERAVRRGEDFLVLNHGRPAARISPAVPRQVTVWDDHLATAVRPKAGLSSEVAVRKDRDGRW